VTVARDRAIREVWTAYTDVRLAVRRLDVADALVDASQKSYEATLESYRRGLGTLIDLLAARRELSRARFVALDTKLQLLEASSALAFATGELLAVEIKTDGVTYNLEQGDGLTVFHRDERLDLRPGQAVHRP
jgi:outer membrane protein